MAGHERSSGTPQVGKDAALQRPQTRDDAPEVGQAVLGFEVPDGGQGQAFPNALGADEGEHARGPVYAMVERPGGTSALYDPCMQFVLLQSESLCVHLCISRRGVPFPRARVHLSRVERVCVCVCVVIHSTFLMPTSLIQKEKSRTMPSALAKAEKGIFFV